MEGNFTFPFPTTAFNFSSRVLRESIRTRNIRWLFNWLRFSRTRIYIILFHDAQCSWAAKSSAKRRQPVPDNIIYIIDRIGRYAHNIYWTRRRTAVCSIFFRATAGYNKYSVDHTRAYYIIIIRVTRLLHTHTHTQCTCVCTIAHVYLQIYIHTHIQDDDDHVTSVRLTADRRLTPACIYIYRSRSILYDHICYAGANRSNNDYVEF